MAAMVRFSACVESKSVDARTITPPFRQPLPFNTSILALPAFAVPASLVQEFVRSPCRFRVPPAIMIPRSLPGTFSVRVMVALRVCGLASVPISSSPYTLIDSVVSSMSALSEKLSLPSIRKPPSDGGLTSRSPSLPFSMVTVSPAPGTFPPGQVPGLDQRSCLPACAPCSSTAATTPNALTSENAATSNAKRNERYCLLMSSSLVFKGDSAASRRADLRAITLPPGLMRLHYSSSVDVCQPIRPIATFVAAGISQFSCARPGPYGLPVPGFAKPQFSTFVCEDLKSSHRFLLPDFVTPDKFY